MPTPTYTPLATITLGSSASSVTFSSIPTDGTYRDLVVVINGTMDSGTPTAATRFNGNADFIYSSVFMRGDGSATASQTVNTVTSGYFGFIGTARMMMILQVMDYSATDKHKTYLSRSDDSAEGVRAYAGRWANTGAVNSVQITTVSGQSYAAATTFSLYGIAA